MTDAAPGAPRQRSWPAWMVAASLAVLGSLVVLGLAVSGGNVVVGLVPLLGVALAVALWKLPLRLPALLIFFLTIFLEGPFERPAQGLWETPLFFLAKLLLTNLNTTTGVKPLAFTPIDLLVAGMLLVMIVRGPRLDQGRQPTARPVRLWAVVSLGACLFLWLFGLARGGNFTNSLWQIHKIIYLSLLVLLFSATLRGKKDHQIITWMLLGAALYKAALAIYVRLTVDNGGVPLATATSHDDSILFANACLLPLIAYAEKPDRRRALVLLTLPLILGGMLANGRRIVWVEVVMCLLVLYFISPRSPLKRKLSRILIVMLPLVPIYVVMGWNSSATIFKPLRTLQSVSSPDADRSTMTRDIENFNLIWTLKENVLLGTGFGHEYQEKVVADDISLAFPQYRYIPHNGVLGLWAFTGLLGFTGLWMILALGVFFAARSYRFAADHEDRTIAFWCISSIAIFLVQAYGDMGTQSWMGPSTAAMAVAMAGKLAVAMGAWPRARLAAAEPGQPDTKPASEPPRLTLVTRDGGADR